MATADTSGPQRPRDGPATVFEADPKVGDIFTTRDGDYFGLVLVAGWRFDSQVMDRPFTALLEAVEDCFDPCDLVSSDDTPMPPAVYLYPQQHLHVTVATFAPPERRRMGDTITDYETFQKTCTNLVEEASQLLEWPTQPMQFVVESTQLGSKAGILLWKDITGGVQKVRQCLQEAARRQGNESFIHAVPGIIHSTFLRFSRVPQTPGQRVQERYQSKVVPRIQRMFSTEGGEETCEPVIFFTNSVKLVVESTPYMHIPHDDEHILLTVTLKKDRREKKSMFDRYLPS